MTQKSTGRFDFNQTMMTKHGLNDQSKYGFAETADTQSNIFRQDLIHQPSFASNFRVGGVESKGSKHASKKMLRENPSDVWLHKSPYLGNIKEKRPQSSKVGMIKLNQKNNLGLLHPHSNTQLQGSSGVIDLDIVRIANLKQLGSIQHVTSFVDTHSN